MIGYSNIHTFFLFLLIDIHVYCSHSAPPIRGICTTNPPNDLLKAEYHKLNEPSSTVQLNDGTESRKMETPIKIDTWFHILSSESNAALVTDTMIADQVSFALFRPCNMILS